LTGGNIENMAVFVLPNANAGVHTITVNFTGDTQPFGYRVSEFSNIATSSPVSGSRTAFNVKAPTLSAGAFTPSNNDGNGGNLILTYVQEDDIFGNPVTYFSPGSGASLLDADIYWHTRAAVNASSQYQIQTTSAPINPAITASMGASSPFNVLSLALRAATAGTAPPAGIRIVRVLHFNGGGKGIPLTMQAPTSGNLFVMNLSNGDSTDLSSVTDTAGNTWTKYHPAADVPLFMVAANATPSNSLMLTLTPSKDAGGVWTFYDITGAASSPVGAVAYHGTAAFGTSAVDFPAITPTQAVGLTIVCLADGQGPVTGFYAGAPANAIFDAVNYTGQTDGSEMDHSDGKAHAYTTSTAQQHWNWTMVRADSGAAQAIHFKQ
jgi:hypothetical protein